MQMRVTYLPVNYKNESQHSLVSQNLFDPKARLKTHDVDIPFYDKHLNEMGAQNWELVSVQPLPNVEYTSKRDITVTGGFYLFWQRKTEDNEMRIKPAHTSQSPSNLSAPHSINVQTEAQVSAFPDLNRNFHELPEQGASNQSSIVNSELKNKIDSMKEMLRGANSLNKEIKSNENPKKNLKNLDGEFQDLDLDMQDDDHMPPENALILPLDKKE